MSVPSRVVDLSPPARSSSRARFDQDALNAFKEAVEAGRTVGDGEPVDHQSTAYQRAKTLCEKLAIVGVAVEPVTWKENNADPHSKYQWAVRLKNSANNAASAANNGADKAPSAAAAK